MKDFVNKLNYAKESTKICCVHNLLAPLCKKLILAKIFQTLRLIVESCVHYTPSGNHITFNSLVNVAQMFSFDSYNTSQKRSIIEK